MQLIKPFLDTRCTRRKRVTSLRGLSPHHCTGATQPEIWTADFPLQRGTRYLSTNWLVTALLTWMQLLQRNCKLHSGSVVRQKQSSKFLLDRICLVLAGSNSGAARLYVLRCCSTPNQKTTFIFSNFLLKKFKILIHFAWFLKEKHKKLKATLLLCCCFGSSPSNRDVRSHTLWLRILIRNFHQYPNPKPYPIFIFTIRILIRKIKKCKLIKA